jgi:excisionase family DNA binding protein
LTKGRYAPIIEDMRKKKQRDSKVTIAGVLAEKMDYGQTATFLGVSKRTLGEWVKSGAVPHYKVGRRVYFDEGQLFEWLESCRRGEA